MERRHKADTRPPQPPRDWREPQARRGGLLGLQRTAGNRAATAYVQRLSVSRIGAPTAIVHEHQQLTPDYQQTVALLDQLITERGWKATDAWAYRFINADPLGDIKYGGDLDLVGRCRQRLKDEMTIRANAVKSLTGAAGADFGDVRMAGGRFVTAANEGTLELLKHSEATLKSEMTKYGLKVDGYVLTDYSMTGGPLQDGMRDAARDLAANRRGVDALAKTWTDAKTAVDDFWKRNGPVPSGSDLLTKVDAARTPWIAAEDAYRSACSKAQIAYPVLAAYSTADDAAAKLGALATANPADMAKSLYKTIDERLKNIETVRAEIGDRFNPWKHAQIVALTKKRIDAVPWEQKVIDEKAATARTEDDDTAKVWAAVAIGLGLLAAIPTGGSSVLAGSVLAGVAAASATLGAAYSLNNLYEHYRDFQLASAETGTTLDKAQAISHDEPSMTWLAWDLLDMGLNVIGAAAAFKTLRTAMVAAEAGGLPAFKALIGTVEHSRLSMAGRSRAVAATLEKMGGSRAVAELMQAIKDSLAAANPGGRNALIGAIQEAANILEQGRKIGFVTSKGGTLNEIERLLKAAGEIEPEVTNQARKIAKEFADEGLHGLYVPKFDFILVRESPDMASMLAHELAHRGQHIEKQMTRMGTLRAEFQAHHMQRQVLLALPEDMALASPYAELRTASDKRIVEMIMENKEYKELIDAEKIMRPHLPAIDTAADAKQIEQWFLKGSTSAPK